MSRIRVISADLLLVIGITSWLYVFNGCKGSNLLLLIIPILLTIPAAKACIKMHINYYQMTKRIY